MPPAHCAYCDRELPAVPHPVGRTAAFCSDRCRFRSRHRYDVAGDILDLLARVPASEATAALAALGPANLHNLRDALAETLSAKSCRESRDEMAGS